MFGSCIQEVFDTSYIVERASRRHCTDGGGTVCASQYEWNCTRSIDGFHVGDAVLRDVKFPDTVSGDAVLC